MKILIDTSLPTGPVTLKLLHGSKESIWNVKSYSRVIDRARPRPLQEIFDDINAYWATLPEARQTQIWDCYQEAHEIFDAVTNGFSGDIESPRITKRLIKIVTQLYDLMPEAELRNWRKFHSNIKIPAALGETYDAERANGANYTRSTTYLREDYEELVDMAVGSRPMIPIWGAYINFRDKETGNAFKEYFAVKLIENTWLIRLNARERLMEYIQGQIDKEFNNKRDLDSEEGDQLATTILSGVGTSELPMVLLSIVLVRRLTTIEFSSEDDRSHMITNLHQFVQNKIKTKQVSKNFGDVNKFGGRVLKKKQTNEPGEENQQSPIESNKVKQVIPDGDIVVLQSYSRSPMRLVRHIPNPPKSEIYELCVAAVDAISNHRIEEHQVVLTQYMVAPAISPRSVRLLRKHQLMGLMALSQAYYWEWGFYEIAALVTATTLVTEVEATFGNSIVSKIPKELMAPLSVFPTYNGKRQPQREANSAAKAIDELCKPMVGKDWQLHCPAELLPHLVRHGNTRRMTTPIDIQRRLAQFALRKANL